MTNAFFKKIENGFHAGVQTVESVFTSSEQEGLKIATASAHYIEQNGGKVLRDAASAGVIAAETVPGGGEAKAAAAFASISAVLVSEGLPVVKSAINLAIEMALADAKTLGLINSDTPVTTTTA